MIANLLANSLLETGKLKFGFCVRVKGNSLLVYILNFKTIIVSSVYHCTQNNSTIKTWSNRIILAD